MTMRLKMPGHIHFPHYLHQKLNVKLEELYASTAIMDFAVSALALFEPIYLWSLGYGVKEIMLFYLAVYVLYYPLVPLGGKFVSKFGHERSIFISTVFFVLYYAALINIKGEPWLFAIAPLFYALQKTFYWPAYHFDFIRFSAREERGSEFSALWALTTFMTVLGPIAGGFLVKYFGFSFLFIAASGMILLSSIPHFLHHVPRKMEEFSYWKSFLLPFRRRYWKSTIGYLSTGNELIFVTLWPVFISLVFGDFLSLGVLVGLSAFVTAMITLWIGKWSDRTSQHHVLSFSGVIGTGVWILKTFIRSSPLVFLLDIFGRISFNAQVVSMTSLTYDRAHEDDYSWHGVYYEQGYALGKTFAAASVILLASVFDPFSSAFVAASVLSLLYLVF